MSGLYSARASFNSYFYWVIFFIASILVTLFLWRMITLAGEEEEAMAFTTSFNSREQLELYRELRAELRAASSTKTHQESAP
jgi:cytoskeletal protein RodZ